MDGLGPVVMLRALAVEISESEDSEGTDEEFESDPTSSTSLDCKKRPSVS